MSIFELVIILFALAIVPPLFICVQVLRRIDWRLEEAAKYSDGSVHDALHPVFSARQLRLARQRFEDNYKARLQLEKQLRENETLLSHQKGTGLSPELGKYMRNVCEAVVETECSWKEYAFMVSGNVLVANRSESGRSIVEGWNKLLKKTRGIASIDYVAPNQVKLEQVNEVFENWRARLCDQAVMTHPDGQQDIQRIDDELFQDVWEDRKEWQAPYR